MTRRAGKAGSTPQRVPNPFESTQDTSTAVEAPTSVFPVRRFTIEDGPAPQRAYGHVLTPRGWVREEQHDNG